MAVAIEVRRSLPPGGRIEHWAAADGWPLRVGVWSGGARGTLLLLNGRGDFFEKYCEAFWHWRARGWAVVAPDWRGQGGSGRWFPDARAFETMEGDLAAIAARVGGTMPGPLVAVGHSMGGHLLLRTMARPGFEVARAVLLSPMMALPGQALARPLAWGAVRLGLGARLAPGQAVPSAAGRLVRAARLTSDPDRQTDEDWWLARHPELESGGATWGWLDAALRSIATLGGGGQMAAAAQVRAVLAADDRVVDSRAAAEILARRLGAGGVLAMLPGEHELLRERDATRAALYAAIDPFLEQA